MNGRKYSSTTEDLLGEILDKFGGNNIVDSDDKNNIYIGIMAENAAEYSTDEANCIIQKISIAGSILKILFAEGNRDTQNLIFDNRAGYTYKF